MVYKIFKYDWHFINIAQGKRDWGEWNQHFQAETNNSSHNEGDMFFLWQFVNAFQTFFKSLLDIGELR